LKAWPEKGPRILWRKPGGVGMTQVAAVGNKLYTLVQHDEQQFLLCLAAETGDKVWETPFSAQYENGQGDGPRGTPTIVGGRAFVYGGEGVLAAIDLESGKLAWKHDVPRELGGKSSEYGMACSPLAVGELIVVQAGVKGGAVAAYRQKAGELAWKSGDDTAGYSSPILTQLAGKEQIVAFTGKAAVGLSPADGRQLWRYGYTTEYDCNTASPVAVGNDRVLISSGEDHGSTLLAIEAASGANTVREVWKSLGKTSVLRCEWQTPALVGGMLYGLDNLGSAGPVTHLTCVKLDSGERVWQQPRFGKSNFSVADGKLWGTTMKGEFFAVQASAEKFSELGRMDVLGQTRTAPSIANGRAYVRDGKDIVAIDIRNP
jgi:outer membrane protein assembly factor BamB